MNTTFSMLMNLVLFIAVVQGTALYGSEKATDENQNTLKDSALTTSDKENEIRESKSYKDLLIVKTAELERVLFLAKKKFSIKEEDYNVIFHDMIECIELALELQLDTETKNLEMKQANLEERRGKCEIDTKSVLKKNYDDFVKYLAENNYEKTSGWENVVKADGIQISILGIVYVFSGLVLLVFILNLFGRIFVKKEPVEQVITIEMDDSPVRGASSKVSTRTSSTILIRKDLLKRQKEEAIAKAEAEKTKVEEEKLFKEREQEMKEISAAIAMAIHAELHLYAKSEQITTLDYPNVVSSWAFSSRPVLSHFQRFNKR
ncbi:MAG: OadG family protein [Candidatus Heimdallarchaeota archaeon]|nr:OadG family protein [Candidatus Heimdallarchaeota archaeon]